MSVRWDPFTVRVEWDENERAYCAVARIPGKGTAVSRGDTPADACRNLGQVLDAVSAPTTTWKEADPATVAWPEWKAGAR